MTGDSPAGVAGVVVDAVAADRTVSSAFVYAPKL